MGWLLHLVQRGGGWVGCGPAQSPPRCTKCNSSPINRQFTNLTRLGSSFKGCFVILYADDILLLSPSVSQLERLYIHLYSLRMSSIKKTIKKQQQTTKQTGINTALTMISSHNMLGLLTGHYQRKCSQRNFSGHRHCGSDSHIVRKYSSRQFLLSSKIDYRCGCHLTGISQGIWLYECLFGKWLVKNTKIFIACMWKGTYLAGYGHQFQKVMLYWNWSPLRQNNWHSL